jgi:hypothetical protein
MYKVSDIETCLGMFQCQNPYTHAILQEMYYFEQQPASVSTHGSIIYWNTALAMWSFSGHFDINNKYDKSHVHPVIRP